MNLIIENSSKYSAITVSFNLCMVISSRSRTLCDFSYKKRMSSSFSEATILTVLLGASGWHPVLLDNFQLCRVLAILHRFCTYDCEL